MTDYYPLIGKAVAGLDKNTGEARRALYERARTALVGQLRNMTPPLTESEITRERLALEEAIRKVEAEAARRLRMEPPPRPEPPPAARPPEPPPPESSRPAAPPRETAPRREPPRGGAPPRREVPPPPPPRRDGPPPPPAPAEKEGGDVPEAPASRRNRFLPERPPLTEQGLRGFRDVVAEAENLGEKAAQAAKSARQAYAAVPTDMPEFDRVEPRLEAGPMRPMRETPPREGAREAPPREAPPREAPPREAPPREGPPREGPPRDARALREAHVPSRRPPEPPQPSFSIDEHPSFEPAGSRRGMIAVILTLLVILALGLTAYLLRNQIAALTGAMRALSPQQQEAAPSRPKIPDRVGQDAQSAPRPQGQAQTTPTPQQPLPAVAQRVVLYEEDPADPNGKRYVGSALWRTETLAAGSGQSPELTVRCDVEIPERRLAMTFTMRRNTDQALPASHTVEIMFNVPADFPFGGISNVPGILMKQAEQTRGAPLSGLAVKVTAGFFLLGLSSVDTEKERNIQLLKERAWFDIPVVYNNGRRAIIAIEKGNPGERAFKDAFAAWGQ
jgi:hypothetical protein